jgi:hypothetical protein
VLSPLQFQSSAGARRPPQGHSQSEGVSSCQPRHDRELVALPGWREPQRSVAESSARLHLAPSGKVERFHQARDRALIAVIGTGITAVAAVYSATRQSATAFQVAAYNGEIAANLAAMKESADTKFFDMKETADRLL